jgi:hypothetical protein
MAQQDHADSGINRGKTATIKRKETLWNANAKNAATNGKAGQNFRLPARNAKIINGTRRRRKMSKSKYLDFKAIVVNSLYMRDVSSGRKRSRR